MKFGKNIAKLFLVLSLFSPALPVLAQDVTGTTNDSLARINIYPNPAFGTFFIEAKNIFPEAYTVNIYGSDGNLVWERRVFEETMTVDLPGGNYTVQIIVGDNVYYKKVIVR